MALPPQTTPRNRTIDDSGVRLDGDLWDIPPITGTGVTPEQAAELVAPLMMFLDQIPYRLDAHGKIDYQSNTLALSHAAQLTYGPPHPLAGQTIEALYSDGAYIQKFGGAPMPYIDFDTISPYALEQLLRVFLKIANTIAEAT